VIGVIQWHNSKPPIRCNDLKGISYTSNSPFCPKFHCHGDRDQSRVNHRPAVAQPCVNGDRLSKGKMAKFDPAQIQNPSTNQHKIWNRWLRRQDDPPCKISCKSVYWGLLGKWVKYNENFSPIYIPFFCWLTYRSDWSVDFHARWLKRCSFTQGWAFLGVENLKLISNPWKIPLTVRRCDDEWYHLFMTFAVFDVSLIACRH